ncbi:copper chaperone for superoxide dismutase [Exaiptasia diaphana]|uniref:Superoxide dismutase copper chaperone n=1 Tax=Exaiptasia diaphana TaxID=2652724 RepID=A0A913WPA3_EXADI|nr:copper chaperone for superoxide dismutase [Exaiptasia diaphana]KXJ19071.1 Copper chaperone for superoxide dismutase [Exaiptasia diaphana]
MADSSPTVTKIEFAVKMTCGSCADKVKSALEGVDGIKSYSVDLGEERVVVDTVLASGRVQELIETTGLKTILRGHGSGGDSQPEHLGAAVAMMSGSNGTKGLTRFVQVTRENCVIDGTIDGLSPGLHGFHIHEFGDLSNGCNSTGDHFNPYNRDHGGPDDENRHIGDLGNVIANSDGRATFRIEDSKIKVWDIIGRAVVIHEGEDDLGKGGHPLSKKTGNSGARVGCGIIARSAGLFQNTKKYCACDGRILWEDGPIKPTASQL